MRPTTHEFSSDASSNSPAEDSFACLSVPVCLPHYVCLSLSVHP